MSVSGFSERIKRVGTVGHATAGMGLMMFMQHASSVLSFHLGDNQSVNGTA